MKKLYKLLLSALLFTVVLGTNNQHIHDKNCGYDPITDSGCIYKIDFNLFPPDNGDPKD